MKSGRHRVVILTATKEEYRAVRQHLDGSSIKKNSLDKSIIYEEGKFYANDELWDIKIAQIGPRNVPAALKTSNVIRNLKPPIILFLGTACGINLKDLRIGDVVVATTAYDIESGYEGEEFYARPVGSDSDERLINLANYCITQDKWRQRIQEGSSGEEPMVYVGPVGSGSKIVASTSSSSCEILRKHYNDILSVDMESYGFLRAAQECKQEYAAVIRGISDFGEGKDEAEEKGAKGTAMKHASAFAFELIASLSQDQERSIQNKPQLTDTIVADDTSKFVTRREADKPISVFNLDDSLRHIYDMLNEAVNKCDETSNTESKAAAGLRKCSEQVKQLINERDQVDFIVRIKKLADSVWVKDETGPQALAKEVIANPKLLTDDLIEWLCSEEVGWRSFTFFRELGKLDSAHQFTKRIEQVGKQQKGVVAFANYFEGLSQIDREFVAKLLNEFTERQSVTADAIVAATGSIGYDSAGYLRIERLLRENNVNLLLAKWAIHSHKWIDQLSVVECSRLMKLIAGPNLQNAVAVIDYLAFWKDTRSVIGELADLAWQCLEAMPSIKTDQYNQSHNFDELAALLAKAHITRGYKFLENLLKQPNKRQSWDPLSILGEHQFWNVLWEYNRERTLRFVLKIALGSPLGDQIMLDLRDIIDQDRNAEVLIKVALESERKAKLICLCLTGCIKTTSKFWNIAFRIIDQYPKNERIKNILTGNVGPRDGWVEDILRDLKGCLKEVEDLRGNANTPKSAQPWLKQVDSYIRGEISRWKSSDEYEL